MDKKIMIISSTDKRILLNCTIEEARQIQHSLEFTTNKRYCMGMCEGVSNGLYIRNKKIIKQLNQLAK